MIQFNLLPDIKLDYIKAKRSKRSVMVISFIAAGAALALFILLFLGVNVAQKKNLSDLSKDINTQIATLEKQKDLDKVLTIQNQLNSITSIHDQKPVTSRVFGYLTQITPAQATISNAQFDFVSYQGTIDGNADNLTTINKFADTLKFATYKTEEGTELKPFKDIITTLSRGEKGATYTLKFNFESDLFNSAQKITLIVPKIITTRSETEKPTALFVTPDNGDTN